MSKDTHSSENIATSISVASPAVSSVPNRIPAVLFGIFSFICEFFSFIFSKIIQRAVIFWTVFHSRILVPLAVFFVAFASIAGSCFVKTRDYLRIKSHTLTVAMAQFRSNRLALAISLLAVTFTLISSSFYSVGIKVIANGEELGYMYSRDEYTAAIKLVEERASEILGRPYCVTTPVRFELGIVPREKVIPESAIHAYFFDDIQEVSQLYALIVDGEVVGASRNREILQGMIDELLYTNDPNVRAKFTQDVEIVQQYVDASKLISYAEIREKLKSTIHSQREYTVKSGDTLDKIAKTNGMTKDELLDLNPNLSSRNLRAGKKITVAKAVPFLSVEAVRRVEYTESIPFDTKKVEDSSIYKGSSKVVTKGRVGTRTVIADVTYVDNKEVSRDILSSQISAQPVTEVIHVGTKARPKTVATGKLSRPISGGIISSNYGMRRGKMHKGVDFAARTGTRISAADGGTVTWAGWRSGGWGYLVVINHGNGMETYYAHNSRVTVKVGQKVAKGEQIAKMGSTGNSSGPHVHFEIHVNGRYVNPWNYIK